MPPLNDIRIDELRDLNGNLPGRAPAQEWLRPDNVMLRQKTFRHVLEGTLLNGSELEFILPWSGPTSRCVKPGRGVFEGFLGLATAKDDAIRAFAAKHGPLLIFCEIEELDDHAVVVESCEVWRYFAGCMKSLLRLAASFNSGRKPDPSDWLWIGVCPMAVIKTDTKDFDWQNPSPKEAEKAWKIMVSAISKGLNQNRTMWASMLNTLLGLGRVRPWVNLNETNFPRLVFTGSNMLSYLALQLCLTAARQDAFAVCSYCNKDYSAQRAPKTGQRNFCPDCRARGVSVKVAQRARRERLRNKRQ
jgi:hypothetical protein